MTTTRVNTGVSQGGTATFTGAQQESAAYQYIAFAAPLSSTDTITVNVYLPDGNTAVAAPDVNGVTSGLSNTVPVRVYRGGPTYSLTKVGTAGTSDVYWIPTVVHQ